MIGRPFLLLLSMPLLWEIEFGRSNMAIFDLYSKRQKQLRGEVPDVFTYDEIPNGLRVQIVQIWTDAIGEDLVQPIRAQEVYHTINRVLCREYSLFQLTDRLRLRDSLKDYFLAASEVEKVIDIIELTFRVITDCCGDYMYMKSCRTSMSVNSAIAELNGRFLEWGVGYQFESGIIIRKDSEFLHVETMKPVLGLLQNPKYKGANDEFLTAHEHYRNGNEKEALSECLKSFESTMKAICTERNWAYSQNDTAKRLIEICLTNGLIPSYLQSHFTSLRMGLESGVPTVRNRLGGHGQGVQMTIVPGYLLNYMIHLTATTILMLIEAEKALP